MPPPNNNTSSSTNTTSSYTMQQQALRQAIPTPITLVVAAPTAATGVTVIEGAPRPRVVLWYGTVMVGIHQVVVRW